jgi:hypothetical protein
MFAGRDHIRQFEVHDTNLVIRRFMNRQRFEDFVRTRSLYFAPASTFEDKLEGHYTRASHQHSDQQLASWGLGARERQMAEEARRSVESWNQRAALISCWTTNSVEDPKMWKEYGREAEAVAVETSVGTLRLCLTDDFVIAKVRYIEEEDLLDPRHSLEPFLVKRRADFSWESEIRIIAQPDGRTGVGESRLCPVDLGTMIKRIVVSPSAPREFFSHVNALAQEISSSLAVTSSVR